jgi:hypothetical protein
MRDSLKIGLGIIIGVLGLALCGLCVILIITLGGVSFLDSLSSFEESPSLAQETPTPQPMGSEFFYEEFSVKFVEYEFSSTYAGEYNTNEEPPEGAKFLWVYFVIKNISQNAAYSPSISSFSIIYMGQQVDKDLFFIERPGYELYDSGELFPGISREGWVRFTLPGATEPDQIILIFKPVQLFGDGFCSWKLSN